MRSNRNSNFFIFFIFFTNFSLFTSALELITVSETADFVNLTPSCNLESHKSDFSKKCITKSCARRVTDGLFHESDIKILHTIVEKGMSLRPALGGPTILDINTGYIRDTIGLENLFSRTKSTYSSEDFSHYGAIIKKLKDLVVETFHISDLHFTAPTFITRLDGNSSWAPEGEHDEYWHPHVDGDNTKHYHYSGLLYMSTYNADFKGGLFHFLNENRTVIEQTVEPKAGRVVIFSSGKENPHYVDRVTFGSRYVLAFWFTCDPERKFEIFLDGKSHTAFSNVFAERLQIQANEYERKKKEKLSKKKKISKKESKAKKSRKSGDDL